MPTSDSSRTGPSRTRRHVTKAVVLTGLALFDRVLRPAAAYGAPERDRCWCCGQVRPPEAGPGPTDAVTSKETDDEAEDRYQQAQCDCEGCTKCSRVVGGRLRPARAVPRAYETGEDDCVEEAEYDLPRPPYVRAGGGRGAVPCFLRGTRIRTAAGDRRIEALAPGELLPSLFGGLQPVRRVRRTVLMRAEGAAWPVHAQPIRIAPSAIADGVPAAPLLLTAAHALLIDGCLIPAGDLVNETTIVPHRTDGRGALELFHIELDRHDVIEAEGCPCESLLLPAQEACAPRLSFDGRRREVASRLRSAIAPWLDRRQPLDIIRDRVEARGEPR
jgi:hypothetical protein